MVAKNRHLKKMQKMLDDAESDAIESDMISDPEELQKLLRKLEVRDKELTKEVNMMPSKIGSFIPGVNAKNPSKRSTRKNCNTLRECCMTKSWRLKGSVGRI
jgi:hypothetical protein